MYYCPRGPMDKASDYESGDCGFESHRGCFCKRFRGVFGSVEAKKHTAPTIPVWSPTTVLGRLNPA